MVWHWYLLGALVSESVLVVGKEFSAHIEHLQPGWCGVCVFNHVVFCFINYKILTSRPLYSWSEVGAKSLGAYSINF